MGVLRYIFMCTLIEEVAKFKGGNWPVGSKHEGLRDQRR